MSDFLFISLLRLGAKKKEALAGERLANTVVTVQRLEGVEVVVVYCHQRSGSN